jgi:hypothetical protein
MDPALTLLPVLAPVSALMTEFAEVVAEKAQRAVRAKEGV